MNILDFIKVLRDQEFKVIVYDHGSDVVQFCVGIVIEEPIDIWYASKAVTAHDMFAVPYFDGIRVLYFPHMPVDKETYGALLNESS